MAESYCDKEFSDPEGLSDEEVFVGKLTLKEVKRMLGLRLDKPCKSQNATPVKSKPKITERPPGPFETQSQPNLRAHLEYYSPVPNESPLTKTSDESFVQMENLVTKLCLSPRKSDCTELNNTLEIIDYILQHGAEKEKHNQEKINNSPVKLRTEIDVHTLSHNLENSDRQDTENINDMDESNLKLTYPTEEEYKSENKRPENNNFQEKITEQDNNLKTDVAPNAPNYYTPNKINRKMEKSTPRFKTPISHLEICGDRKTPAFKTPTCRSVKKAATPRTIGKPTNYNHIVSPIANYIRNSPQVPLVKDVHPRKPLPGLSSIPKLVKHGEVKKDVCNKEKFSLPSVAYKNSKITKVIQATETNRLPHSQWTKKMTSSVPTVMKHENRKLNSLRKPLGPNLEDTLTNLTCHQADVSLCTQKTAFNSINKKH